MSACEALITLSIVLYPVCGHADRLPDLVAAAGVPRVPLHHPLPPAHGQRHPETSGQWPRPQQGECIYQSCIADFAQ